MGQGQRKYEKEYKVQAVKLAKEIGAGKAAQELGIPVDTLYGWQKAVREGRLDAGPGIHTPETAMSLAEELAALRKQVKVQERFWKSAGRGFTGILRGRAGPGSTRDWRRPCGRSMMRTCATTPMAAGGCARRCCWPGPRGSGSPVRGPSGG